MNDKSAKRSADDPPPADPAEWENATARKIEAQARELWATGWAVIQLADAVSKQAERIESSGGEAEAEGLERVRQLVMKHGNALKREGDVLGIGPRLRKMFNAKRKPTSKARRP